ncbi:hypothetical protein C6376_29645 [Streptomyces sp. P3]|nr:hypothetical protein C6376_29645 [Streptomyces sp. P3]
MIALSYIRPCAAARFTGPRPSSGRPALTATGPDRLCCHVRGRSVRSSGRLRPGRPYSFVAAPESDRTSWCRISTGPGSRPGAGRETASETSGET